MEERLDESYNQNKVTFSESARKQYEKSYGIVGNHSGIQICHWTKQMLRGKKGCYKVKFYGVDCHRCAQISPALAWCNEACTFCWRPMEWMKKTKFSESEVDDPKAIIEGCVKERDELIAGFGAANTPAYKQAFRKFPSHWAISLSGEPTIYPKLAGMVKLLKENPEVRTIFIVTNGQEPEQLKKLAEKNALPTQLYLSLSAANEGMFKEINRSVYEDGWDRLNKTIDLFPELQCRRAIRFTLIKGINDREIEEYAKMIERSQADFIEIKSYMALGFSRKRLGPKNMLELDEVNSFVGKMLEKTPNYQKIDEDYPSRIVLLKNKNSKYLNIIR